MVPRLLCFAVATVVCAYELKPVQITPLERYPSVAHAARITGDVRVKCVLSKDGSVVDAIREAGHPILVSAVAATVKLWRSPSLALEPNRTSEVIVRFRFRLVQPGTEGTDLDTLKSNTRVDSDNVFVVTAPEACIDFVPCSAHWR